MDSRCRTGKQSFHLIETSRMQQIEATSVSQQTGFPLKFGDREINLNLSRFSKTFFCIGPVCLRSGVAPMIGAGCGVGIIRGPMLPLGDGKLDFLRQLPGGYQIMNVLNTILRKFPGAKTGVGCGGGAFFGYGIGFTAAGSSMNVMQGMSGMSGIQQSSSLLAPVGGTSSPVPVQNSSPVNSSVPPTTSVEELERKVKLLEEKVGMHLKLKDLEQRLEILENRRR